MSFFILKELHLKFVVAEERTTMSIFNTNNTGNIQKEKKPKLVLKEVPGKEGLNYGIKKDGKRYSVRDDRSRYFYPDEWNKFYNELRKGNKLLFDTLIGTGARIEEALNIRPKDFIWERNSLTLVVTKIKARKGETKGKKRTFKISSQLIKKFKKHITKNNIKEEDRIFKTTKNAAWKLMRRILIKANIEDYYNFSLHNIRKTHGNWLKALEIPAAEICLRFGHNMNTYLEHYGSATLFDRKDKQGMIKVLGDLYGFR